MDNKTKLSSLGEAKVIAEFISRGHDVYTQFSGKGPFDLIVHKEGVLKRVEVKSTSNRTLHDTGWRVQIRKIRSNKKNNKIYKFNPDNSDLLAIYIVPLEVVVIFNSNDITVTNTLTIKDTELNGL